ncbi:unnamed protein product [Coregonus sp. 'balchen']|nr:unnamed protein product [Coregonus sp. 'balchen']
MEAPEDVSVREQLFHDRVRETIIRVLLFIGLYIISYLVITHYKRNTEFTIGCVSVRSLSLSLWALSYSYLSPSCPMRSCSPSHRATTCSGLTDLLYTGVMARLYETAVVLFLLTLLVLGMVWVASAILDDNMASLYVCTPLGLSRMFSITGSLLVKPKLLEDLDETMSCAEFEEASLSRKLTSGTSCWINVNAEVLRNRFFNIQARTLSWALPRSPCLVRITRFDLLGDFGQYNWLGNFHIVFLYNVLFAGLTSAWLNILPLTVSRSTIPLRLLLANGLSKIQ